MSLAAGDFCDGRVGLLVARKRLNVFASATPSACRGYGGFAMHFDFFDLVDVQAHLLVMVPLENKGYNYVEPGPISATSTVVGRGWKIEGEGCHWLVVAEAAYI